jgi:hypothetical protein
VINPETIRVNIDNASFELSLPGADLALNSMPTKATITPKGASVRLRTNSCLLKTELVSPVVKEICTVPVLPGEIYDVACRVCSHNVASNVVFRRVLEQPPEDIEFFCHGHDGLRPQPRHDDLLYGPGVWITNLVPDRCVHCGQRLGLKSQEKTTLWNYSIVWKGTNLLCFIFTVYNS